MVLFVNVFLSNRSKGLRYDRGRLDKPDRVDVFKYSLASLAPLTWSHVVIHYELGPDCAHRRAELETFIQESFDRPVVHRFQNQYQAQWQDAVRALEALGDPLVWFCCNDDHVFVDSDTSMVERIERTCLELSATTPFFSCVPTHWPEYVAGSVWTSTHTRDYCQWEGQVTNSMQIVPVTLLKYWWFEHDYRGAWMPRSDAGTLLNGQGETTRCSVVPPSPYPVLVPYKELVRHFDGYSHVGVDLNACPPLAIPEGFFSGTMRVQHGGQRQSAGDVLVDPTALNYSAVDPDGADWKGTAHDLPLFWRSQAGAALHETAESPASLRARNRAVMIMAAECEPVPASRLEVALRFADDADVSAETAALDAFIREWRIGRSYERMRRLRTVSGIERQQAVLGSLGEADDCLAGAAL